MAETLFILLTAHFLGDFVLQTEWVVQRKKQLKVQLMHAALVTVVSALMLGSAHMTLLAILFLSHLAMDALKVYLLPNGIYMFLLDQLVHIGVICALAYTFSSEAQNGFWLTWLSADKARWYLLIVTFLGGFLFAAKSILRFGEIKDSHQRKMAEYIIIGTFLSFGWALITSYLTQQALRLWHQ